MELIILVTEPVSNTMDDGYKAIAGAMEGENWDDELEEVVDPFNVQYGKFGKKYWKLKGIYSFFK